MNEFCSSFQIWQLTGSQNRLNIKTGRSSAGTGLTDDRILSENPGVANHSKMIKQGQKLKKKAQSLHSFVLATQSHQEINTCPTDLASIPELKNVLIACNLGETTKQ